MCSTCGNKPARSGQRTCAECHASYMRGYRALIAQRASFRTKHTAEEVLEKAADILSENGFHAAADLVRRLECDG